MIMKRYHHKVVFPNVTHLISAVESFGKKQFILYGNGIYGEDGNSVKQTIQLLQGSILLTILDWEGAVELQLVLATIFRRPLDIAITSSLSIEVLTLPQPTCSIAEALQWAERIKDNRATLQKKLDLGLLELLEDSTKLLLDDVLSNEPFWLSAERLIIGVELFKLGAIDYAKRIYPVEIRVPIEQISK